MNILPFFIIPLFECFSIQFPHSTGLCRLLWAKSPTFKTGNSVSEVGLGCLFDFDLLNVAHAAFAVAVGKDNQPQLVVLQAVVISENGAFSASIRAALIMSCYGTPVSSSTFCGVNCIT